MERITGFMMSEPSCERAFPLTAKEILLQSVSLLKPGCNRHKHAPPPNPPMPFTFSRVAPPSLNLPVMMQLTKSGESVGKRGGGEGEEKEGSARRASGNPEVWKMCTLCLFILLQRAQFPGSVGVKHTRLAVTSHLCLA